MISKMISLMMRMRTKNSSPLWKIFNSINKLEIKTPAEMWEFFISYDSNAGIDFMQSALL